MNNKFTIISGPCAIDDDGTVAMTVAEKITRVIEKYPEIDYIFKSSWIKANRTRDDAFEGIGFDQAMKIFTKIKENFNVRVLTDIHESEEVKYLNDYIDVLKSALNNENTLIDDLIHHGLVEINNQFTSKCTHN